MTNDTNKTITIDLLAVVKAAVPHSRPAWDEEAEHRNDLEWEGRMAEGEDNRYE